MDCASAFFYVQLVRDRSVDRIVCEADSEPKNEAQESIYDEAEALQLGRWSRTNRGGSNVI